MVDKSPHNRAQSVETEKREGAGHEILSDGELDGNVKVHTCSVSSNVSGVGGVRLGDVGTQRDDNITKVSYAKDENTKLSESLRGSTSVSGRALVEDLTVEGCLASVDTSKVVDDVGTFDAVEIVGGGEGDDGEKGVGVLVAHLRVGSVHEHVSSDLAVSTSTSTINDDTKAA